MMSPRTGEGYTPNAFWEITLVLCGVLLFVNSHMNIDVVNVSDS